MYSILLIFELYIFLHFTIPNVRVSLIVDSVSQFNRQNFSFFKSMDLIKYYSQSEFSHFHLIAKQYLVTFSNSRTILLCFLFQVFLSMLLILEVLVLPRSCLSMSGGILLVNMVSQMICSQMPITPSWRNPGRKLLSKPLPGNHSDLEVWVTYVRLLFLPLQTKTNKQNNNTTFSTHWKWQGKTYQLRHNFY